MEFKVDNIVKIKGAELPWQKALRYRVESINENKTLNVELQDQGKEIYPNQKPEIFEIV